SPAATAKPVAHRASSQPKWKKSAWRKCWARRHAVWPRRKWSKLQARNRSREADELVFRPALLASAGRFVRKREVVSSCFPRNVIRIELSNLHKAGDDSNRLITNDQLRIAKDAGPRK